jgi:hypothetical protein
MGSGTRPVQTQLFIKNWDYLASDQIKTDQLSGRGNVYTYNNMWKFFQHRSHVTCQLYERLE